MHCTSCEQSGPAIKAMPALKAAAMGAWRKAWREETRCPLCRQYTIGGRADSGNLCWCASCDRCDAPIDPDEVDWGADDTLCENCQQNRDNT